MSTPSASPPVLLIALFTAAKKFDCVQSLHVSLSRLAQAVAVQERTKISRTARTRWPIHQLEWTRDRASRDGNSFPL
ncbi:hypothetical protein EV401DRAFT_1908878 [Pisolithus croceorrhizus]|nr:hypothetical protein EV401DRAFT_1908878 [Pisolithus croceorrhizus]